MGFRLANVQGRAALIDGGYYFDVEATAEGMLPSDPMAVLEHLAELHEIAATIEGREPAGQLADTALGPPMPRPQKSFAVGLNYLDHAAEGSMKVPVNPLVFTKFPSCLAGPNADVELRSDFCDYEGELVVVIGRGGKDIDPGEAWSHVAGVMVGQDISDRMVQFAAEPPHFDLGKSFDTFGPIGPVLVSTDLVGDPSTLRIVTTVNGEERQNDSVSNMVFDVPTLVGYLSQITTLVTGDLVFTGTPAGVGASRGTFLANGDLITTTIDGIGTLVNRCRRVGDHIAPGDRPKETTS